MICAAAKFTASRPDAQKRFAIAGNERRSPRDIAAGFADRIDHAQHHVINQRRIEVVAVLDRAERLACKIERSHFVERTVHFAAAAGCTHVIVDESVGHGVSFANMSPTRCGQGGRAVDDQEPLDYSAVKPDSPYSPSSTELQRGVARP
jgi:hypothetical protein